jgi:hypothetical protein
MITTSVLFKHEIGSKDTPAIAKRRRILLEAVPEIEKSYNKAHANQKNNPFSKSRKDEDEALRFYNSVITDGRYVHLLATKPQEAADKLGLKVSEKVFTLVQNTILGVHGPGTVEGPLEAVIAVAVVIACAAPSRGEERVVIDSSANISFKL